jgi:NAD(P)-dependent dehydrogenase (short-subunit alcohol dehydrogenase family)
MTAAIAKTALVTGGTDGIGKEIARGLALAGHQVIVVGRDLAKGARVEREFEKLTGTLNVRFLPADLGLVAETERVAQEIARRWPFLNFLVHSAGVVRGRRVLNSEGVESNFATNYLSRFVLTRRLMPLLNAAGQPGEAARIVVVSGAAQRGKLYFEDVNLTSNFNTLRAVGQCCRANDVLTIELPRRLATSTGGPCVSITCLKIGVVKTNIRRDFPWWMRVVVPLLGDPLLGQTPGQAAEPALRLLLDKEFEGVTGALFLKIKRFKPLEPAPCLTDPDIGTRLWELSENMAAPLGWSAETRRRTVGV